MRLDFEGGRTSGLRSSLHYASTPTLNSSGNSSVDESSSSSTGSASDYWENNSASSSSNTGNEDYGYHTTRIFIQNPNRNKSTRRRAPRHRTDAADAGNLKTVSAKFGSESQVSASPTASSSAREVSSSSSKFENEVRVTAADVCAVDTSLRGHRTKVFVCESMANLYTCPRASTATPSAAPSIAWSLAYTGIPALILVRQGSIDRPILYIRKSSRLKRGQGIPSLFSFIFAFSKRQIREIE